MADVRPAYPPSASEVAAVRIGLQEIRRLEPERADREADLYTRDFMVRGLYWQHGDIVAGLPGFPRIAHLTGGRAS